MSDNLYILPPSLKPCEPVDGSDTRYLNQTHVPIVNPLQKPLSIELYNEKWFSHPPNTSSPPFLYDHATLSFPPADPSPFPTLAKLHEDTHTSPPTPLLEDIVSSHDYPLTPSTLHKALSNYNGLFFIQYTPEDTFKSRWFLVQINHFETLQLQLDSETTGDYHVTFLSRHPSDNTLCDDAARWWPLWYEYVLDKNNVPVYGARILFGPTRKPDLKKYILWTDSIHLTDPSCFLHGRFSFDTRSDVIKPKQYIALTHWEFLLTRCSVLSIAHPNLSTLTYTTHTTLHKRKK